MVVFILIRDFIFTQIFFKKKQKNEKKRGKIV